MSRIRAAVVVPVVLGLLALVTLALRFGARQHYEVLEQLAGINAFWHDDEAFIFVNQSGYAHRQHWLTERAPAGLRAALMRSGAGEFRPLGHSTTAYHLTGGRLDAHTLDQTPIFPAWDLEDGNLVARPRHEVSDRAEQGFRWTGSGFERVGALPLEEAAGGEDASRRLKAGDEEGQVDEMDLGSISPPVKKKLEEAGWHFKALFGYEGIGESVELPIELRDEGYSLSLRATRPTEQKSAPFVSIEVTVGLAGKTLQPSPQILFSGGSPREVSREEFDRLVAGGPAAHEIQGRAGVAAEVGRLIVPVVCAVFAVWLLWKGPTRELKIAVAVLVVAWIVPWVATEGWGPALLLLMVPPTIGLVSMLVSTRLVRYRTRRTLVVVGEDSCPTYARAKVRELSSALEAVGFRHHADRQNTWQMTSQDRRTFIRLFIHSSGHVWAEIQATDEPKAIGRTLCSVKGETIVLTCDLQSNQELLRDPETLTQRVPRAASCSDMLRAHDTFAMKTAGTLRTIVDPVAADAEGYNRWVNALVRSKQVSTKGGWFKIAPRAVVPVALRVMGAWFH